MIDRVDYTVVITDTIDNSDGKLEVTFYVLTSNGDILSGDALLHVIEVWPAMN